MWNFPIAGVDMYRIICYMIIFSFLGWVWECIYVSIRQRKIVNRGYVTGPVCTIYGCGAVSLFIILKPVSGNVFILFVAGIVIATLLEYVTAAVMELIFHTSWWDYTHEKFNYKGRICLKASCAWGVAAILLFEFLIPFVDDVIDSVSVQVGRILICVFTGLYVVDFIMATIAAVDVSAQIRRMDIMLDEVEEYLKSTKIYSEGEELKNRIGAFRANILSTNYFKRYSKRLDVLQAVWKDHIDKLGVQLTADMKDRVKSIVDSARVTKSWNAMLQQRIMNAYPRLKSSERRVKEYINSKANK